jgi:hypothetical protein
MFKKTIWTIITCVCFSFALMVAACATTSTGEKTTAISTEQIVSGAQYLIASVEAVKPSIQTVIDSATDVSKKEAATNLLTQINQFETSVNTFVNVAKASQSASDVNSSYATLKSTLQGILAAAAPYLIQAALASAS